MDTPLPQLDTIQLTSMTGVMIATTFVLAVLKRTIGNKPYFQNVPIFVYVAGVAMILAFTANKLGTLEGSTWSLVWKAALTALSSSGFYSWLNGSAVDPLKESRGAREDSQADDSPAVDWFAPATDPRPVEVENMEDDSKGDSAMRSSITVTSIATIIAGALLMGVAGCASSPAFYNGVKATWGEIGPEYREYVKSDPKLTEIDKSLRIDPNDGTAGVLDQLIDTEGKRLQQGATTRP